MSYTSTTTLNDLAGRIAGAARVMVTAHEKPDGDAIGSILALVRALESRGQSAIGCIAGPVEACLLEVARDTPLTNLNESMPGDDFDLALVVDTGAWTQLATIAPWLREHADIVCGIDHHAHGDNVAAIRYVEPTASSTTQILLPLIKAMPAEITTEIAEPLFLGLATDTGWFRHANADAAGFATAAELLAHGVDKPAMYQLIEESHSAARLRIEAQALGSLEFAHDEQVSLMSLKKADLEAAGGSLEDLTGLVNMPMIVGSVRVSVLLVELDDQRTKISLRSKPASPVRPGFVDVNRVAQQVGGGGHKHAAGGQIDADLPTARRQVLAALEQAVATMSENVSLNA